MIGTRGDSTVFSGVKVGRWTLSLNIASLGLVVWKLRFLGDLGFGDGDGGVDCLGVTTGILEVRRDAGAIVET